MHHLEYCSEFKYLIIRERTRDQTPLHVLICLPGLALPRLSGLQGFHAFLDQQRQFPQQQLPQRGQSVQLAPAWGAFRSTTS